MKSLVLLLIFLPSVALAERLEDIRLLDTKPGPNNVELKLQAKRGPPGSFFFLDITKNDPDSFDKLIHVINKIMGREKYRLDLNIPSFSVSPNGSYYRSEGIDFYSPNRESSRTHSPKR